MKIRTLVSGDMAIDGRGAFVVRDPVTDELLATRAGMFLADSNGFLITYDRKRLQGFNFSPPRISDLNLTFARPATTDPDATTVSFWVDRAGGLVVSYSDGTSCLAGCVATANFEHPERLRPAVLGQFSGVLAAEPQWSHNFWMEANPHFEIQSGALELINVTPDLLQRRRQFYLFQQGALAASDRPADLAIDGNGFFLVRDPVTGGQFATRSGSFRTDANGFVVNDQGLRLQGNPEPDSESVGDLRVPTGELSVWDGSIISVGQSGYVMMGKVLLIDFKEPFLLRKLRSGLLGNLSVAQPRVLAPQFVGGLGRIRERALELPNEPESFVLPSREGFRFLISGGDVARWTIQTSSDLENWRTLEILDRVGGELEYNTRSKAGREARYYRAIADYDWALFNRPEFQISNVITNFPQSCDSPRLERPSLEWKRQRN